MTTETLRRCKCGDPINDKGLCAHCDTGWCNSPHPTGEDCGNPRHDFEKCPRCITLREWLPQPGDFPDLPNGYENHTGK